VALLSARIALRDWSSNAVFWGVAAVLAALAVILLAVYWWWSSRSTGGSPRALVRQGTGGPEPLDRYSRMKPTASIFTAVDGQWTDMYTCDDTDEWRTDYGLLETNYSKETFAARSDGYFTVQFGGRGRAEKLLRYDVGHVTGWASIFRLTGSALDNKQIWLTCAGYWVLVIVLVFAVRAFPFDEHHINVHDDILRLTTLTNFLAAMIAFMLGLYASILIARWWSCRMDCLETVFAALSDVQLFLAVRLSSSEEDVVIKEMILRYSLLTHRLVLYESRSLDENEYLEYLKHVGLLKVDEADLLRDRPAKASAVLVWIGKLYTACGLSRKWLAVDMVHLDAHLERARNGIGQVSAYTDTQLPYQYVHLLTLVVISSNLILCVDVGLSLGTAFQPGNIWDPVAVALQIFRVFLQTIAYHAFLRLGSELSNPFGNDFNDFPMYAYHCMLRREGLSISKAGEKLPKDIEGK
jgi:predicted membrane chloride channel (bestrophin family)